MGVVVVWPNKPIALALTVVLTAAVTIVTWAEVLVVKATMVTAITATEILHMLVLIEFLTKCVGMAAGYASNENTLKSEYRTHRPNKTMMLARQKRAIVTANHRNDVRAICTMHRMHAC